MEQVEVVVSHALYLKLLSLCTKESPEGLASRLVSDELSRATSSRPD